MHQYRSDITYCFVWLGFHKWFYTYAEIHSSSVFLFFNLTTEPNGRCSLTWTGFGQSVPGSHSECRHAWFFRVQHSLQATQKGKKANSIPSVKKSGWKEATFMYMHMVVISFFICQLLNVSFNVSFFSFPTNINSLFIILTTKENKAKWNWTGNPLKYG